MCNSLGLLTFATETKLKLKTAGKYKGDGVSSRLWILNFFFFLINWNRIPDVESWEVKTAWAVKTQKGETKNSAEIWWFLGMKAKPAPPSPGTGWGRIFFPLSAKAGSGTGVCLEFPFDKRRTGAEIPGKSLSREGKTRSLHLWRCGSCARSPFRPSGTHGRLPQHPRLVPGNCGTTPGQAGLVGGQTWTTPSPTDAKAHHSLGHRVQLIPGTAEPRVRLQDVLQRPNTTQAWIRVSGSCFNTGVQLPPALRAFESRIQGSILRSLVSPCLFPPQHPQRSADERRKSQSSIPPTPAQQNTQFHPKSQGQWQTLGFW